MSSGKVLLGLVAGAAAGALAGILFAPHRGSVTRKKISRKSGFYAEGLKEKFNELVDSVTEKLEKVKGEVSDFTEQKMSKADASIKDAKIG